MSADPVTNPTRLETRFGTFEITPDQLVRFPTGIPGFEQNRTFVLISARDMSPLQCLQATEGPPASFLVIDPRLVIEGYRTTLNDADKARLQVVDQTPLLWLAIITLSPDAPAYVNLRAPIVINPARMLGCQVIPSETVYPMRHPLPG